MNPDKAVQQFMEDMELYDDEQLGTALFANVNAYKTFVQRGKDNVKEFSRIAGSVARTFESTSREFANNRPV